MVIEPVGEEVAAWEIPRSNIETNKKASTMSKVTLLSNLEVLVSLLWFSFSRLI